MNGGWGKVSVVLANSWLFFPDLIDILHAVRVHANETGHLDPLLVTRVEDVIAPSQRALVRAHIRQLPKLAPLKLKGKADKRLAAVLGVQHNLLALIVRVESNVFNLEDANRVKEWVKEWVKE